MSLSDEQRFELSRRLKMLGAAKLSNLIGQDKLEAINAVIRKEITEINMVNMLTTHYGSQILAQKPIREAILNGLPKPHLNYLLTGEFDNNSPTPSNENLQKLLSARWGRESPFSIRFLSIFNLGNEYLPAERPDIISEEILLPSSALYDYQKRVKDRLLRSFFGGAQRVLIHMPTGAGKTRTATEGIVDYWRTTGDSNGYLMWLTDSEELCSQAEETFKKIWKIRGDSPIKLYKLWGDHTLPKIDETGGIIIASLQRLHRLRTSPSNEEFRVLAKMKTRNRLVVVDEAHKSIAPTYMQAIEFMCDLLTTKLLGLTATPGRTDPNQVRILVEFYHNNKISITDEKGIDIPNPILYLQQNEYLSQIDRRTVKTNVDVELTAQELEAITNLLDIPASVLRKLSKNDQRNARILSEIIALVEAGRQTIVFACSVEHAHLISELLTLKGIQSRCVDGGTASFDRANFIEEFKNETVKVLVNYGVLTTGFDAPNTNAVVITRPTTSLVLYSQMIGRGIRGPKMGGTEDCILVDVEDNLIGFPSEQQAFNYFDEHWEV
jgi:superfamily II DNA or RNA helicase